METNQPECSLSHEHIAPQEDISNENGWKVALLDSVHAAEGMGTLLVQDGSRAWTQTGQDQRTSCARSAEAVAPQIFAGECRPKLSSNAL